MSVTRVVLTGLLVALSGTACADDAAVSSADFDPGTDAGRDSGAGGGAWSDASGPDDGQEPEPEVELKLAPPSATRRYVFIASRSTDQVARIDSVTLAVDPIRVGNEPTVLRTLESGDVAVVLNEGESSVSIIGDADGAPLVSTVRVGVGANALDLDPTGRWAVAWYNNRTAVAGDPIGSLQEVSLIDVRSGASFVASVGFAVRAVRFDETGATAYVVTDSGVNRIDLDQVTGDLAVPTVDVGGGSGESAEDREIQVAPEAEFAVVRSLTDSVVRVVDLVDGTVGSIALDAPPTDIDLLDGDTTVAVALRDRSSVVLFDPSEALEGSASTTEIMIEGATPGQITPLADGSLLAWSALQSAPAISRVDRALRAETGVWSLRKAIVAAVPTPNGRRLLVVHAQTGTGQVATGTIDDVVQRSAGVTVVDLDSAYAKLTLLAHDPDDFVFVPDGSAVYLMLADAPTRTQSVERIDLNTFARQTFHLEGIPEAIGYVPDSNRVWVSQESATGRITFIDAATGQVDEISGYQLNAWIE